MEGIYVGNSSEQTTAGLPEFLPHYERDLPTSLLHALEEKNLRLNEKLIHMGQRTTRAKLMSYFSAEAQRRAAMNSTFRSPASSLRITSAWSAAGCRWSLEKCGMRACLTFIKATFFSRRQRRTVFLLLRVKNLPFKPPLGVLASADTPGRMLGFYRRRAQLRTCRD